MSNLLCGGRRFVVGLDSIKWWVTLSSDDRYSKNVILVSTLVGAGSVTPFVFLRLMEQNWPIVILDSVLVVTFLSCFFYVRITGRIGFTKWVASFFFLTTACFTIYLKGPAQLPWLFPSMVGVFFLLGRKWGIGANIITLVIVLALTWDDISPATRLVWILTLTSTNAFAYVFALSNSTQREKLKLLSNTDSLTKIANRRAFDQAISAAVESYREDLTAYLIIFDIDHFKSINDQHGHSIGDKVISAIAQRINGSLRQNDHLFRIGGEEFALLIHSSQPGLGRIVSERMLKIVNSNPVEGIPVTVSIGVACLEESDSFDMWYNRADEALYRAKQQGRNQAILADQPIMADQGSPETVDDEQHSFSGRQL